MWAEGMHGERREFFRVEGQVRLHYRKLEDTDPCRPSQGGCPSEQGLPEENPEGIPLDIRSCAELSEREIVCESLARIARIETKLDKLTEMLGQRLPEPRIPLKTCFVNISGCGMRFPTAERFQVGDQIEVSLELPMAPDHLINVVGEVVHVLETAEGEEHAGPYQTAIRFLSMNETDRESILRCSMHRQYDLMSQARQTD